MDAWCSGLHLLRGNHWERSNIPPTDLWCRVSYHLVIKASLFLAKSKLSTHGRKHSLKRSLKWQGLGRPYTKRWCAGWSRLYELCHSPYNNITMVHVLENNIKKLISNGKQDETTMCVICNMLKLHISMYISIETISWLVDQLSTLLRINQ